MKKILFVFIFRIGYTIVFQYQDSQNASVIYKVDRIHYFGPQY